MAVLQRRRGRAGAGRLIGLLVRPSGRGALGVVGACLAFGLLGCGGGGRPEQRSGSETAAAIRSYLAGHFVDQPWYSAVKQIEAKQRSARIRTSLPGDANGGVLARQLCSAVLRSGQVSRVLVYSSSGRSLHCS